MTTIFIILGALTAVIILSMIFLSKPYPKEWEERENEELKRQFEANKNKDQE